MKHQPLHRLLGMITLCLALTCSSLWAGTPAVLKQMPADAALTIATQPLQTLNSKATALATKLNLPIPPNQPVDLGLMLGSQIGIPGQMDATKGIGVSVGNLMQSQQTMAVYLPILNAENTLQALGGTKDIAGPGIWTLPNGKGFAKNGDGYLIIAMQPTVLTNLANNSKGVTLSKTDEALFGQSDIAVTANVAPLMGMAKMKAAGLFMNNPEAQKFPAVMQLVTLATDRLAEIDTLSFGLSLEQSGINLGFNTQARPASELAAYFSNHPTTDISALSTLPPNGLASVYVFNYNGEPFRLLTNAVIDILANDPTVSEKIGAENIATFKKLIDYKMDARGVWAEYATMDGTKKMLGVSQSPELDKMLAAGEKLSPLLTKIISQFGVDLSITYQAKAGTIGDLSYDEVAVDLSKISTDPMVLDTIKKQWGESLVFKEQFLKLDDDRLAIAVGEGGLEELVTFMKSGKPGLDKDQGIINSAKNLPSKANVYIFSHVGNAVRSLLASAPPQMMMMAGMLTQIQGVIGVSVVMEDGNLKTQTHIPDDVIQSVGMLIQQMMMMQQQQQAPSPAPQS